MLTRSLGRGCVISGLLLAGTSGQTLVHLETTSANQGHEPAIAMNTLDSAEAAVMWFDADAVGWWATTNDGWDNFTDPPESFPFNMADPS